MTNYKDVSKPEVIVKRLPTISKTSLPVGYKSDDLRNLLRCGDSLSLIALKYF